MKRIKLLLCAALMALITTTSMYAQQVQPNNTPRSEQFILDSLRMEIEKIQIESQCEMYSDSLQTVEKIETEKILSKEENLQYLIPLIFFLSLIAIVWISLFFSRRKKQDRYRIIELALEKGESLPQGLFDEPKKREHSWLITLRHGTVTLGIGLGLLGWGLFADNEVFLGLSFIPLFLGLGYLLVAFLENREEKRMKKEITKPICDNTIDTPVEQYNNEANQ